MNQTKWILLPSSRRSFRQEHELPLVPGDLAPCGPDYHRRLEPCLLRLPEYPCQPLCGEDAPAWRVLPDQGHPVPVRCPSYEPVSFDRLRPVPVEDELLEILEPLLRFGCLGHACLGHAFRIPSFFHWSASFRSKPGTGFERP